MRKIYIVISLVVFITLSCTKDIKPAFIELDTQLKRLVQISSPTKKLDFYVLPDGSDLSALPQDEKNPLTEDKVTLGKLMFYDTGLAGEALKPSGVGTYSCATCHLPEAGFYPNTFQGIADGGSGYGSLGEDRVMNVDYVESELDVQSIRPLSLVNVGFVENTFWNGQFGSGGVNEGTEDVWDQLPETELNKLGFSGIETQNMEGLHTHRIKINKEILDTYGYTDLYDKVFRNVPIEERYTVETASLAYSAYIRSIISDEAPFQKWLKGDNKAMSDDAKKGGMLFFGKAQCNLCHYNENLGSPEFQALGVYNMYQQPSYNTSVEDRRNLGRGGFTGKEEDNHKFKVPGLYNVADNNFFFHGASLRTLEEVVEYKNLAVKENPEVPDAQMSEKFNPLLLTAEEKYQLVTFLKEGLTDPNLMRYVPERVPSGNCFPNNDPQSKIDTGCQ